jgi:2-oxo-4-hydroxy-4-carboxy--5-ureidoimidazoline (OHCU) decarboxylase
MRMRNALTSADEHAQTQCVQRGDRLSPRLAAAQTTEKQHAGLLKLDVQHKARLAPLAVTHRYNRTHCLWLEQFQIA